MAWLGPRGAIAPGARATVRWTALTASLCQVLRDTVLPSLVPTVEISGLTWRILRVLPQEIKAAPAAGSSVSSPSPPTTLAAAASWAGESSYESLAQAWLLDTRRPPARLNLLFASPTAFHSGGLSVPLPLPRLVFGSLLERWNALAPLRLGDDILAFAEREVAISRHRLQTEALPLSGGLHIGFTGRCTYVVPGIQRAPDRSEYAWRALHLLAAFAFYAGAGIKTTMGMGMARASSLP